MANEFVGAGKISVALFSSGATFGARKFRQIGNSSAFSFSFSESEQKIKDYTDPAGGDASVMKKIDSFTGSIDAREFTPDNLALALWGTVASGNTTAITGESHVINAGAFIPTARLINTAVAPVVKKGATVISTNDYTVSKGGILIAATISTAGVVDGDAITIDYTPAASKSVQALVSSAPTISIMFEGINLNTGKYCTRKLHKVKLGAAQNVAQIGDDFGTLALPFAVEKDTTIVTAGLSQYMVLEDEN